MNNENQISRPYIDINSHDQFFSCNLIERKKVPEKRRDFLYIFHFCCLGDSRYRKRQKEGLLACTAYSCNLACTTTRLGVPKDFASRKGWSQLLVGLGHSLDCMAAHHGLGKLRGSCIQRP